MSTFKYLAKLKKGVDGGESWIRLKGVVLGPGVAFFPGVATPLEHKKLDKKFEIAIV